MANVKRVLIRGYMRFDGADPTINQATRDLLLKELGVLNLPVFGIRIKHHYGEWPGQPFEVYVTNEHGGRTCMVAFEIYGREAVSAEYTEELCRLIERAGGWINLVESEDLEENELILSLARNGDRWTVKPPMSILDGA